jgi:hypothetical protein
MHLVTNLTMPMQTRSVLPLATTNEEKQAQMPAPA